jgi:MscS family membrane protein
MIRIRILPLILLIFASNLWSQSPPTGNLESPYEAVYQHLYYLQEATWRPDLAADALLPVQDSALRVQRGIQLKQILDGKGLFVRLDRLPRDPDWIDSVSGQAKYILYPLEQPTIYLERSNGRWHYSRTTWEAIPHLHRQVYPFGTDRLVNVFGERGAWMWLGLHLWQWVGVLGLLLLAAFFYYLFYILLIPISRSVLRRYGIYHPSQAVSMRHMDRALSMWIIARLIILFLPALLLSPQINEWMIIGLQITSWILVLLIGLQVLNLVFFYLSQAAQKTDTRTDEMILPILKKMAQLFLWIFALVPVLRLLEINLTALIAGLSIGGLALALAAQDTVKNLISTVLIFFDHPYKLGDYIKAAGVEGTVVEIGFRSTRMMTIDSSIITIPNSNMINDQVVNLGVRKFRLIQFFIGVVYSTPPDTIDAFIKGLRQLAHAHPDAIKENIFVYLHELNNSSIDIRFRVPINAPDLRADFAIREELVFGIIRLARDLGISFAFPSQSVYVESFPGQQDHPAPGLPEDWSEVNKTRVEKLMRLWSESRADNQ